MINIADDFTQFPGGRYKRNGKGSGEEFREKFLVPHLKAQERIVIDLDGVSGYPPSFLEEAFGGLIRQGYSEATLKQFLSFKAGPVFDSYIQMIWGYISKEARQVH